MEVPVPPESEVHATRDKKKSTTATRNNDYAGSAHGYLPPVEMESPVLSQHDHPADTSKDSTATELHEDPTVNEVEQPNVAINGNSATNPADRATSPSSSNADSGINHVESDVDPYYWDVAAIDENIDAYYCYDTHAYDTHAHAPTSAHAARAAVPDNDPYAWPPRSYNFHAVWRAAVAAKTAPAPVPVPAPTPAPVAREETAVVVDVRDEPAVADVRDVLAVADVCDEPAVVDVRDEPAVMDVHDESVAAPAAMATTTARAESVDEDAAVADAIDMWKLVCQHYAVASALDARPSTAATAARVR
ncbi:hypothetical protein GGF31_001179 [Allomyces arbusculus]|nr:hypothetical protein GGF31_001179 [Allomyces arbusculus]